MTSISAAGVDWAGDKWLIAYFEDGAFEAVDAEEEFQNILASENQPETILVDVPIGLPDSEGGILRARERLDSRARKLTGRPSSVFPVPSRKVARAAYQGAEYEDVAEKNQSNLGKGLNKQSYYIPIFSSLYG